MPSRERRLKEQAVARALSDKKRCQWAYLERKRLGVNSRGGARLIGTMRTSQKIRKWEAAGEWDRLRHLIDIHVALPKDILPKLSHPCLVCGVTTSYTWCQLGYAGSQKCFGSYDASDLKKKLWDDTVPYDA